MEKKITLIGESKEITKCMKKVEEVIMEFDISCKRDEERMTKNKDGKYGENVNYNCYIENILCWNCGRVNMCEIPRGTTIEDYNEKNKCNNCGCNRRLK